MFHLRTGFVVDGRFKIPAVLSPGANDLIIVRRGHGSEATTGSLSSYTFHPCKRRLYTLPSWSLGTRLC